MTVTLFLYLLALLILSPLTFLGSDSGLRFLQLQQLISHNWQTFAIDYPTRSIDPHLQHVPYYYAYLVVNDQLYLAISPFLPLLTSVLYVGLGAAALPVVPVLGGVVTALAVFALAKLSRLRYPRLVFLATLLATPLLFYSLEFWDHTPGTALAMWGVYGLARGLQTKRRWPLLWGGTSLGLALGQRPELYVFALALAISIMLVSWPRWREWLIIAGGGLMSALPIWALQYVWFGHPLGMSTAPHLLGYGKPAAYSVKSPRIPALSKAGYLLLHVEPRSALTFLALLLVMAGSAILIFQLRPAKPRVYLLAAGFALTAAGYLVWPAVVLNGRLLIGLLSTFSLLPLSLTYLDAGRWPQRTVYHLVLTTTLLFVGLMLIFWPTPGGVQWGARYLLPAYPLMVYLASCTFTAYYPLLASKSQAVFKWGTLGLAAAGILLQVGGVTMLFVRHYEQVPLKNQIATLPADIILTNESYLPAAMTAVPKTFIHVKDEADIAALLPRLAEQGSTRLIVFSQQTTPLTISHKIEGFSAEQIAPFTYLLTATHQAARHDKQ